MSMGTRAIDRLPAVEAQLNYLAPMAGKPRTYTYDPPAGEPRTTAAPEPRTLPIHDARPIAAAVELDRQGFQLLQQRSRVRDFYDDDDVRQTYYPEVEEALKVKVNYQIPNDRVVPVCVNRGTVPMLAEPRSDFSKAVAALAKELAPPQSATAKRRFALPLARA